MITYFLHIPTHVDLFSVNTTSSWLSLYTRDVSSLFSLFSYPWWAYFMATCTYLWWPILYTGNHLMTYSVHIPPYVDLFSISTTSSLPTLYTRNFYGLYLSIYFYLVSLCLHEWYFMTTCERTTDDLFCTLTSSYRPILYIWNFLIYYFLHKPPHVDLFFLNTISSWPVFYTSDLIWLILLIYSFLVSLFLQILRLHMHVLLVTYSVHMPFLGDLFCT